MQGVIAQQGAEQNDRNSIVPADNDHQPAASVITGM